jgi:FKBP-type peptidyl-prolyl cis-trans isomerase FklB
MPTTNAQGKIEETTFTQTYYGEYNPNTAAPQLAAVRAFTSGFATALQYMTVGDDWMVYVPQELFYGSSQSGVIPAYSAARFRLQLVAIYPTGSEVPDWK